MSAQWPIQRKLQICVAILIVVIGALAFSSLRGVYSYRELAKTISWRADELPCADELSLRIDELRKSLEFPAPLDPEMASVPVGSRTIQRDLHWYRFHLSGVEQSVQTYRRHLEHELPQFGKLSDRSADRQALDDISKILAELHDTQNDPRWVLDETHAEKIKKKVDGISDLAKPLRNHLVQRMHGFAGDVRLQYQTMIIVTWGSLAALLVGMAIIGRAFYVWVMAPLDTLTSGARSIAQDANFSYRIQMKSGDEMEELADGFNAMTSRFQEIRQDLDEKVKQRTQEVVRSEQLASVGFLAAGVAHEINNPLGTIMWSAESLESRVEELFASEDEDSEDTTSNKAILLRLLRHIQKEADRCKGITDKLLDFSRLGDIEKHDTNLGELVEGVIEMVRHVGNHREKEITIECPRPVFASVNPQEMKQVVLNLITNSLDSLDPGGRVNVALSNSDGFAQLVVSDNGCGMSADTLKHLFEPFFTRRRDGSGTGLGLSITYRIVTDHGGSIEPASAGPGKGSTMRVRLPLASSDNATLDRNRHERETQKRLQAAA